MFGFILGCITVMIGYSMVQRLDSGHPEKKERENNAKLLAFAKQPESQKVFTETLDLLDDLIQRANKEDDFGNLYHNETFEKTVYHYNIRFRLSPTTLSWEVRDLSQSERLRSHQSYTVTYDRSRKVITTDEMRINEGSTYSWGPLLALDKENPILPFSFIDKLDRLNQAGWNMATSNEKATTSQPFQKDMHTSAETIRTLLQANQEQMDTSIVGSIEEILTLSTKIMEEEKQDASDNVEFTHNLNRLLEDEILSILRIYIELDAQRKEEVKQMTQKALGKAYNHLLHQYDTYQSQKVSQLKQTQLVMEERYD